MSINKIVTKVDGVENKTIDFNDLKESLSPGVHTITAETWNGAELISTQTKNITILAAVYDTDYQAVLDAVVAAGDTLPSTAQQDIDNQLLVDYKATGAWAKDDVFLKFSGTGSIGYKLMCWKRLIKAEAFGSLTWSDSGVEGNAANAYINTKFNPTLNGINFLSNDASINYVGVNAPNTFGVIAGAYDGNNSSFIFWSPFDSGGKPSYGLNGNAYGVKGAEVLKVGLNGLYRIDDINIKAVGLGEVTVTTGTAVLNDEEIYILCRSVNGSPAYFWDEDVALLTMGGNKYNLHAAMASVLE